MGLFSFGFGGTTAEDCEVAEIFPLKIGSDEFVSNDILSTYTEILTDTLERTHGLSEKHANLMWDNCVQNEATQGLISLLARAMYDKADLFLVYLPSVNVIRKATSEEETKIREDYKKSGESKAGVYVSFKTYRRTDMLKIYSSFEYCVIAALNKNLHLSKAVQIKINDLRSSVSLSDAEVAKSQAKSIATALGKGSDVYMDVKDLIEMLKPDTESIQKAIAFLDAKRAFWLGLPLAYITGEQTGGIGSSGENDMRAVERGLKQYFVSIVRPVLKAVFGTETKFKSQDFRQIQSGLEVLKTFELVSDENISGESKQEIVARIFDLDLDQERKAIEKAAKENPEGEEDDDETDEPEVEE